MSETIIGLNNDLNPFDEPLQSCDICGRNEISDILEKGSGGELLVMTADADGLLWCEECRKEQGE